MARYFFEIPCPHEAAGLNSHEELHIDHHPLTTEEIITLLEYVRTNKANAEVLAAAQIRLCQAIPGYTCPHAISGRAANCASKIVEIFTMRYREGDTSELASEIRAAIDGER